MSRNLGRADRLARVFAAGVLLTLAIGTRQWPIAIVAALVLATAAAARCPLYGLYGMSTVGGLHSTRCDDGQCAVPGRSGQERTGE